MTRHVDSSFTPPATHAADTFGFLTSVCRKGGGRAGNDGGGAEMAVAGVAMRSAT